jgi:hypothetical protein
MQQGLAGATILQTARQPSTIGFERRVTIAFQVKRTAVVIVWIFYGGQDFESALGGGGGNERG